MTKKVGRPYLYEAESQALKMFSVRLNAIQERAALKLGKGSLSAGIRLALENVTHNQEKPA